MVMPISSVRGRVRTSRVSSQRGSGADVETVGRYAWAAGIVYVIALVAESVVASKAPCTSSAPGR
jgi:hypothetical protein